MTLQDLIKQKFGVDVEVNINPAINSVTTTVQTIAQNNPNRLALLVVNLGANDIYLSPEEEVSVSQGIRLAGNGGKFKLLWEEDFDLTGWRWYAVAGGTSAVYVVEVVTR